MDVPNKMEVAMQAIGRAKRMASQAATDIAKIQESIAVMEMEGRALGSASARATNCAHDLRMLANDIVADLVRAAKIAHGEDCW
jgi:hypothetical protein